MTIPSQGGEFAIALQWDKYEDGFPKAKKAQGTVTFISNPSDADTLTIGGIAYRFKSTPAAAGDIQIASTLADTMLNLLSAIKGTLLSSAYYAGTRAVITVDAEIGTKTLFLDAYQTGQVGNAITLAQLSGSDARYTLSGSTLSGGKNGGAARYSVGRIQFAKMPANTETLVVGGTTYTFSTSSNTGNNINISLTSQDSIDELASAVATRLASNSDVAVVSVSGIIVSFRASAAGSAGNSTVLSETVSDATAVIVTGSGTLLGGLDLTNYPKSSLTWYRVSSREVNYGDNQMQDTIPLEVGQSLTPKGAYKQGANVMGGATIMPRLENSIGLFLLAGLGKVTTTNPSTGVYQHVFKFNTNEINIPWVAGRRMIPGRDNVYGNGIVGWDNKVNLIRTSVTAASPIEMMIQLMGRIPEMDNHPEVWAGNTFEDFTSIPLACKGVFKLPTITDFDNPLPVTQVVAEMINVTTTPRNEMIVGSYFPDDVVPLTRAMTFRFQYKWKDAAMAQYAFGTALKATSWSPTPFITTTSGSDYAVDLYAEAPYNISGTTTPFSLRIRANEMFWQPSPISLRAGDIVTMDMMGTGLHNSSSYVEFVLTNGTSAYATPSEP